MHLLTNYLPALAFTGNVSLNEMLLRLGLAAVLGAIVGYEREIHGRAAGLRTTMLACMAACVASILSSLLFADGGEAVASGAWRPDPARLAQGVLAGMGFLGAGVVVREGKLVRGVTTAAVLWFVTIIGLAIGAGHYPLGVFAWASAMGALVLMPFIERFIPSDWYGNVSVTLTADGASDQDICSAIELTGASVKEIGYDIDLPSATRTVKIAIKYKRGDIIALATNVRAELEKLPGVTKIQWALAA